MGIIIEIENQYVTVKFEDGSIRKYLKENFVNKPEVNDVVEMNNDGIFMKKDLKKSNKEIKTKIVLLGILILVLGTFFVSTAIFVGKGIKNVGRTTRNFIRDCIYDCPG